MPCSSLPASHGQTPETRGPFMMRGRTAATLFSPLLVLWIVTGRLHEGDRGRATEGAATLRLSLEIEPLRAAVFLSYGRRGAGNVVVENRGSAASAPLEVRIECQGREALL